MLVFIIPLKSPKVSSSWETVTRLFERSIRSVCNQTTSNFRVFVVCNEKPKIDFTHPNLTYLEYDFPIPGADYPSKEFDRTRKVVTGIMQAKALEKTSHIMMVDADDCISNNLAEFVARYPQSPGWVIKQGYWYQEGSRFVRVMRKGFDRYCGTSTIIREDLYDFSNVSNREEIANHFYKYYRHREIKETLEKRNLSLQVLPFKGAVYIIDNGENIYSGVETTKHFVSLKSKLLRLKAALDNRLITPGIRDSFGLYSLAPQSVARIPTTVKT
ncbi:MAG: glycosyltransferase family 2 protein [Hydrococcus sp. Prado102]|jgi:hypothetical protein|nr:glycosyltransferase family 2 protein [Hydrococcus sp. Prado102]